MTEFGSRIRCRPDAAADAKHPRDLRRMVTSLEMCGLALSVIE
jgi:hypothetical protein